jgi:hypothetical protein
MGVGPRFRTETQAVSAFCGPGGLVAGLASGEVVRIEGNRP